MKNKKKRFSNIPKPKVTFDRVGQITFTFKEVTKLAFRIKPKLLIAVLVINALWGLSSVPGFYLEKLILDRIVSSIGESNWMPVITFVGFLIILSLTLELIRSLLSGLSRFFNRTLATYFDSELSILIGKKVSELDLGIIEDPTFRDRYEKVRSESSRRAWGLIMPLSDIPNFAVGFISASLVLILVHPLVTLAIALVSLPQILINTKHMRKEYELHSEQSSQRRIWRWLESYLVSNRNYMELKILGLSNYLADKQRSVVTKLLDERTELRKKREYSRIWSFLPISILELILSILLLYWVIIEKITVGSFQLYLRSLRSAQSNLSSLVASFLEMYENYIYVNDLVWFLNFEPIIEKADDKGTYLNERLPGIEFNNVSFKYKEDTPWTIKNVSFEIKPGEKIALVGENGAGKSTLIKLIARFYDPQKGSITLSGIDLKKLNINSWRKKLAVLFQIFELYPFSSNEAIGYGDLARIDEKHEIVKAAKKTGIDEFIEKLPQKYDNPITPEFKDGVSPSIGQWQRFGIARMLFRKNADVIILDEPTSNIDPEAEEKIFKELKRITRKKMLIFVTQRFSTVRIADRIFVMHEGKIIEQGTHRELMDKNGKYARMFNLQAEAYSR